MGKYEGCIIEESLVNKEIIHLFKIIRTDISPVTQAHATPWLKQWTMQIVEIDEKDIEYAVIKLQESLDIDENWYGDLKNDDYHYIIFNDKIFKVDRSSKEQYFEVKRHGLAQGIPDHQLPDESWAKQL